MFHGEEGGSGPGRDPHLPVGVLDVAIGGVGRNVECPGDLFGLPSPRQERDDLRLPVRETSGTFHWRSQSSGGFEHCTDRVGVQPTCLGLLDHDLGGGLGGEVAA